MTLDGADVTEWRSRAISWAALYAAERERAAWLEQVIEAMKRRQQSRGVEAP